MPKIAYKDCQFRSATLSLINTCNQIIAEYTAAGYLLTLRQLYYQLVSRDVIKNTLKEYNKLGNTVNDARLAGLIDWNAIEDRTRNLATIGHWGNPADIIASNAKWFRLDKWKKQPVRPEVWIEKEALAGVFERICTTLDVPYLSCRGYTSQSEMWGAAMRFVKYIKAGQTVHIFHFGDHDPSGIDMSRDIEERIRMFLFHHIGARQRTAFEITRVALNMDQVEQYGPPENPAKSTDTRFASYLEAFGESSWELDALDPATLAALVRSNIVGIRDDAEWRDSLADESSDRATLEVMSVEWEELNDHIQSKYSEEIKHQYDVELDEATKETLDSESEPE
jgi:hypothetical protein